MSSKIVKILLVIGFFVGVFLINPVFNFSPGNIVISAIGAYIIHKSMSWW